MVTLPTREQAIEIGLKLANGDLSAQDGAHWAQKYYYKENNGIIEKLEKIDPDLEEFIGTLTLADAINEHGDWLYTPDDFREWTNEFLNGMRKE